MGESQLCRATHSGGSSREPSQLPGPQPPASPSPPEVLQLPSSEVPWKAQVPPTPAAICSPTPTVRAVMLTLAYLWAALAVGPRSLPSLLPAWRGPLPAVLVFSLWHGGVVLEEWCHCTDCSTVHLNRAGLRLSPWVLSLVSHKPFPGTDLPIRPLLSRLEISALILWVLAAGLGGGSRLRALPPTDLVN